MTPSYPACLIAAAAYIAARILEMWLARRHKQQTDTRTQGQRTADAATWLTGVTIGVFLTLVVVRAVALDHPAPQPLPAPQGVTRVYGHTDPERHVYDDEPNFDCRTDGNHVCGPVHSSTGLRAWPTARPL